jgi:REP element-mobilizing transposase RayT
LLKLKLKRGYSLKNKKNMSQEKFEYNRFYHVFNRGNNSESIFKEQRNYDLFLGLIKKYLLPVADVYAYCLMDNHFHLLVRIKDKDEIMDGRKQEKPYLGFAHLFSSYTQKINKTYNRKGSLFQEQLKRQIITDNDYFIQLVAYIHLNPVKHGFSDTLDYYYSSYNALLSDKKTLLARDEVFGFFGDKKTFIDWHNLQKLKHENLEIVKNEDY